MPYTYLIGWSRLDLWYYGVRYGKGCHPEDLWVTYFTSSLEVARMRVEHGEPDVVEVRRTFDCAAAARRWEDRVLKRVGAVRSPRWLNLQCSGAEFNSTSESTRAKISAAHKARVKPPMSAETKAKIGAWHRGKKMSESAKDKLRAANLGKVHSPESNAKRSAALSGANNPNYGGRHQTEEVRARMRGPRADSSRMGRWERTDEWKKAVAEARRGKKVHVCEDQPGVRKMFVPGSAPPGWHLPGIG